MFTNMIKNAWDNLMDNTAKHITLNKYLVNKKTMFSCYETALKNIQLKNKTIIDYGCGGGWLGKYFQEKSCEIKKYIGFDISKKSVSFAKKNNPDSEIIEVVEDKIDFSQYQADVFISFFVIQHFPNQEYLDNFLESLNKSKIKTLALLIRYALKNKFSNDYKTFQGIRLGCWTNDVYISEKLTKYKLDYDSGLWGISGCKLYIYKKQSKKELSND